MSEIGTEARNRYYGLTRLAHLRSGTGDSMRAYRECRLSARKTKATPHKGRAKQSNMM